MATLERRITELEKQYGETGQKVVVRLDGETDDEARKRVGLAGWHGHVIFLSEEDIKLG